MDTEVGKNLPARILYLKKRKKTRKLLMFLAAIMLTSPPIDRSVWSLLHNCKKFLYVAFFPRTSA